MPNRLKEYDVWMQNANDHDNSVEVKVIAWNKKQAINRALKKAPFPVHDRIVVKNRTLSYNETRRRVD